MRQDDLILRAKTSHGIFSHLYCNNRPYFLFVDLPCVSVSDIARGQSMDCVRLEASLDAIASASRPIELRKVINELRRIYGLAHVTYTGLRMPDLCDAEPCLIVTYPDEWITRYRRENLSRIDPVYVASRTRFLPIDWHSLDQQSPDARYVF